MQDNAVEIFCVVYGISVLLAIWGFYTAKPLCENCGGLLTEDESGHIQFCPRCERPNAVSSSDPGGSNFDNGKYRRLVGVVRQPTPLHPVSIFAAFRP